MYPKLDWMKIYHLLPYDGILPIKKLRLLADYPAEAIHMELILKILVSHILLKLQHQFDQHSELVTSDLRVHNLCS